MKIEHKPRPIPTKFGHIPFGETFQVHSSQDLYMRIYLPGKSRLEVRALNLETGRTVQWPADTMVYRTPARAVIGEA